MERACETSSRGVGARRTECSEGVRTHGSHSNDPEWRQPLCLRQGVRRNRRVLVITIFEMVQDLADHRRRAFCRRSFCKLK